MSYSWRLLAIVGIMVLMSNMAISPVFSAIKHGCAQSPPPAVPGPLAQPAIATHTLFINEILPNPASVWNCSEQTTKDATKHAWIEIFNSQDQPFDLYSVHASLDSGLNTAVVYLPTGTAIAAHGFLVLFPGEYNAGFWNPNASTVRLLLSGTVIDEVDKIPSIPLDNTYARIPDGSDNWQVTDAPTIDASNNLPATPTPDSATNLSTPSTATQAPNQASASTVGPTSISAPTSATAQPSGIQTSSASATATSGVAIVSTNKQSSAIQAKQPKWGSLHVPPTTLALANSTEDTSTPSPVATPPPTQKPDTGNLPQKILLTSLAAGLLLVLLWCARFFIRK